VNPFVIACQRLLGEIRTAIIALCKKYYSGDSTTGYHGELRQHIGAISSTSVDAINAGVSGLQDITGAPGSIRIYSKPGTLGYGIITVQPNVKIMSLYATCYNASGAVAPQFLINSIIMTDYKISPLMVNATTGVVTAWQTEVVINGSFSAATAISAINDVQDISVSYIQPQTLLVQGVA
jgi:hypothetical protein